MSEPDDEFCECPFFDVIEDGFNKGLCWFCLLPPRETLES